MFSPVQLSKRYLANRFVVLFSALLLAVLLAACKAISIDQGATPQAAKTQMEEETMESSTLIRRELLFGNPDKTNVKLSPDGARLSYLAPVEGVLNVWVGPANEPGSARPVTNDTGRGIRMYGWAYTNDHLLYLQDKNGDENWRLYGVNLKTDEIKDLTPLDSVQARIQAVSPRFPNEIMVALNDRVPQLHDLHMINLDSGDMRLILENEGFAGFLVDDDYQVRFGQRFMPNGGTELLKYAGPGAWEPFLKIGMEDALTTQPFGFDKSGQTLYMIDSRQRNTAALVTLDLATGEQQVLYEDPRADLSRLLIHPTEKTVQAAASTYQRTQWKILDEAVAGDLDYLRSIADGDIEIVSRSHDDKYWVVAYLLDDGPLRFYLYDRDAQSATFLFTHRQDLEGMPLAKMHPVTIQSGDGLDLVSYYTLPLSGSLDGDGRPPAPVPMVLLVHGGPWGRDAWGYNPLHQLLADRGYAVLSVNFRGSTGFGKDFINAANMEWGAKMHDDLVDAVNWAVEENIAQKDRVAIMGGSYGGYATLVGMTFTPDTFACGVDIVGPSNLVTLLESIPPYWEPQVELFTTRVGDHRTEEGRALLLERSPLTYVDRIQRPLLIGQGANDPRVKQSESDQIVSAMQEKAIPVTYVLYSDEGHGFARPENNLSFFAVAEAFLSECLGGPYEPIGNDFTDSTISVPVGAGEIPGLQDALDVE